MKIVIEKFTIFRLFFKASDIGRHFWRYLHFGLPFKVRLLSCQILYDFPIPLNLFLEVSASILSAGHPCTEYQDNFLIHKSSPKVLKKFIQIKPQTRTLRQRWRWHVNTLNLRLFFHNKFVFLWPSRGNQIYTIF